MGQKGKDMSNKSKLSKKRSFFKTLTWRCLATTDTFVLSFFITGNLVFAGSIASVEVLTKLALYYWHERIWDGRMQRHR
tara:strand:+ start:356 stop:592 length:237 start_codon:yes stop_codon:yes gene_type:complete